MKKVAVMMGSDNDLKVMAECVTTLREFGVDVTVKALSAHRTPYEVEKFVTAAPDAGFGVIIAAAGKAAHLAGVVAAYTVLPVIAVPIKSSTMDGLDSLLSMVQMPAGVPVATVAIDGAKNAALLAVQILAVSDAGLTEKLHAFKKKMVEDVLKRNANLEV